jgi:hypothetical protein
MALSDERNELHRRDEPAAATGHPHSERLIQHEQEHDFARDIHPERFPRESLSRLDEGILEDDELRHFDDRLGYREADIEHRVEDSRNLSRTLVVLGSFLLIFAGVLLTWVGWDVRSGEIFFSTMCVVAAIVGLGLIAWGGVERQRVLRLKLRLMRPIEEQLGQVCRESELREGDRAA